MNTFGKNFRVTTFGESHGIALGAVIDGCPSGIKIDIKDIQKELDKRKPGTNKISSQRKEGDKAIILSGIFEGKTLGTPITVIVYNEDQNSKDYSKIKDLFRPGHADEAWQEKFGIRDFRGGGRSSGRETLGRVIGGSIAKKFISNYGVDIFGHTISIGKIEVQNFNRKEIDNNPIRCADKIASKKIEELIIKTKQEGNSLGGIIKIHIKNCPKGIGEPVFSKLQAMLAQGIFSIGCVRSLEIYPGKNITKLNGKDSNQIKSGISGGISTGEEIILEIGIKPTPSIGIPQNMKDKKGKIQKDIVITGRHDPCIVPRAIPVIESMCSIVIADLILEKRLNKND